MPPKLDERIGLPVDAPAGQCKLVRNAVKRWIGLLEALFVVFVVPPYSKNVAKAILKEPKVYFFDLGPVKNEGGARLENLVACHLLKRNDFLEDAQGQRRGFFDIRNKDKREADFLTVCDRRPEWLVEVKTTDGDLSPSLRLFIDRQGDSAGLTPSGLPALLRPWPRPA